MRGLTRSMQRKGKKNGGQAEEDDPRPPAPAGRDVPAPKSEGLGLSWAAIFAGVVIFVGCVGGGMYLGHYIGNSPIGSRKVAIKAMYKAIDAKNYEDIEMYIKLGADVNVNDGPAGNTPLMEMVHLGDFHGVDLLLRLGADPSKGNFQQFSPLLVAAWCREAYSHEDPDHIEHKARHTCTPMVKKLLDAGADPNAMIPDHRNIRAIHWLVSYGAVDAVKHLLEAGADPNAALDEGTTPYHLALDLLNRNTKAQDEIVDLLVKHGADTTVPPPTPS